MAQEESLKDLALLGRERAEAAMKALEIRLKEIRKLKAPLRKLTGEWREPKPVESIVASRPPPPGDLAPAARVSAEADLETRLAALREISLEWLKQERESRRRRLAEGLREGCAAASIPLAVVTKDPLELRLPPIGVAIDVDADLAILQFGRVEIGRAPARPDAILAARRKAVAEIDDRGFSPEAFHRDLREAYARAARSMRKGPQDWVELVDVLPEIAFIGQGAKWRVDPTAAHFRGYGKAQFLFDLWRLRRARALVVDGLRVSLGPATGASTKDKRRVFWVEDGEGRGAYHLTMRFVRSEEIHGDAPEAQRDPGGEEGAGDTGPGGDDRRGDGDGGGTGRD